MAMPRVRVRLKLWMLLLLVAFIAFGLGIERRRRDFLARAAHHGQEAERNRQWKYYSVIMIIRVGGDPLSLPPEESAEYERRVIEHWNRSADYHEALRIKYEQAARRPWLPVSPDPPRPPGLRLPAGVAISMGDE
jgi:hypothetical protein